MQDDQTVYFQFKPNLSKGAGEIVLLKDILHLHGPAPRMDAIGSIPIFPHGIHGSTRVAAMQVIRLVNRQAPDLGIQHIGETAVLLEPANQQPQQPLWTAMKVGAALILLLIGSGLAIIYFHADVNMHQAHQITYYLISGEQVERPLLLSISYSVGIGLGIALFFDIFSFGRKKQNPGPLELEMYQNEKELEDYVVHLEGKQKEK